MVAKVTTNIAIRSPSVTPKMFPKRAASKSRVNDLYRLISTMPSAKLAVVITPMAASAAILRFLAVSAINWAQKNPQTVAPIRKFMDSTKLTTAPPSTAWDRPCPM